VCLPIAASRAVVLVDHSCADFALALPLLRLSEMILDKKLQGILDAGSGDLIVFELSDSDVSTLARLVPHSPLVLRLSFGFAAVVFDSQKTYTAALDTVKELSNVIDRLYVRAKKLTVKV
jgi:hypothetical protein